MLIPLTSYGAFEGFYIGVRGDGMANVTVALNGDITSSLMNPASFAPKGNNSINLGYNKLYMMYNHLYMSYGKHVSFGNIGLLYIERDITGDYTDSLNTLLSSGVLESEKGIVFTHNFPLNDYIRAGYNLKLYNLSMQKYGNASAISLDAGIVGNLFSTFRIGAAIHNVNRPIFGKVIAYYVPTNLIVAFSYEPYNGLITSLQFEKEEGYDTRTELGIEYKVIDPYLTVRFGVANNPMKYSAGVSVNVGKFNIEYAYSSQREINDSHEVGISVNF